MLQCRPEHPYKSRGCVFLALIYKYFVTFFLQYFLSLTYCMKPLSILCQTPEHMSPLFAVLLFGFSEYFLFLICLPVLTSH